MDFKQTTKTLTNPVVKFERAILKKLDFIKENLNVAKTLHIFMLGLLTIVDVL